MDASFTRGGIGAVLALYDKKGLSHERGAEELRRAQGLDFDTMGGIFGARWRLANSSKALAEKVSDPLRQALLSLAYLNYQYCSAVDAKFRPSLEQTRTTLPPGGALGAAQIIEIIVRNAASEPARPIPPPKSIVAASDEAEPTGSEDSKLVAEVTIVPDSEPPPVQETDFGSWPALAASPPISLRHRFESLVESFPTVTVGTNPKSQQDAYEIFRGMIGEIMAVGDSGRTFTQFAPLETDLGDLKPHLIQFALTDNPRILQERARTSRRLAEDLNFSSASADDHRCARLAWLLSGFWNSQLARYWGTNRPNTVYDFLGYLTVVQAEIRYSDAEFLLLLRVSFSVCRIASHDGLMPLQFLSTAADRLSEWIQYTVGTVLASAGPGRVPPSRVPFDTRLSGTRRDFAARLLGVWRSDSERAAAATILLEMGAWDPQRATRLLEQVFSPEEAEFEVWSKLVATMAARSKRVRVVRPNPWMPGGTKPLTVEREAVAVLAADVVDRHYQVLGGDISLRGHDFRERRVPTYVCSAEFGPLGLFKLDATDRIVREVEAFAKYAQRLHPRYRASRCDSSKAVITEPDDEKQFVQGALTSYVFTEDETPKTFNSWFMVSPLARTTALCTELFERALRPWYGHALSTTVDVFNEFPMFSHSAVDRLVRDCQVNHGVDLRADGSAHLAVKWITTLLDYLDGRAASDAVAEVGSELQVLRSYRSVCHGDLHLDNVLVIGKPGAEYPCVIDFEATHEGYVLKDFGRFVGSALLRTFEWSADERAALIGLLPDLLLNWRNGAAAIEAGSRIEKVHDAIIAARHGILRAWQAGSYPSKTELVAALVASFLPFARYPDTAPGNVTFCLEMTARMVETLE